MAILSSLFTGSLQTTGSFGKVFVDGTVTASEYKGVFDGALSSSAQISDDISGSFTAVSGGYSTRITAVEGNVGGQGVNTTDSPTFAGLTTTGDVVVQGSLTAQEMIISSSVTQVTTSFSEGSTIFGDSQDDTHQITGSLIVTGSIVSNGLGVVSSSNQISSTFAQTILDDADAGAVRTTIGVDAAGTDNSTNVTIASGRDYVSISGQELTLGQVDISDDTNLIGGTGITLTGDTLSTTDSEIVHDDLSGFVSNEHIDHSGVSITTGTGLTGGGDITSTRTLAVDFTDTTLQSNISGSLGVNAAVIRSLTRAGITGSYNPRVTVLEGSGTIQGVGTTNSPTFAGLTIDGDISASGDITANNYIIKNQVTEMTTSFSQGNTIFGDTLDDRHEFTGSVFITGSLDVTQTGSFGRIEATTISASVLSVDASTIFVGDQTLTETIVGNIQNTTGTNTGDITLAGTPDYITINNQVLTRNTIDIGDDTNLVGGTGITLTGDTLTTTDSEIIHDSLSGFVADEHIDHTGVTLTAGIGLTGGGTIASNRTFDIDFTDSTLQNNISGSLGVNAAEIRTLTKAGISGSWRGELSSSSTTFIGGGVSGSVTSTGSFGRIETAGDLKVDGKITAQEFHTELTTATTIFESGSTQFGNSTDDIHRFTGSILVGSSSLSGSHQSTSSFGTYFGDGSNLTGISGYTVSNETNNRILTSTGTSAGNAEEFLTFDGSTLDVTGAITISGNVNANGNIVGDNSTTISGIDSVTATTLAGTISTATQNSITSATSLASVGTITTGVWNGTTIAVGSGGTGATTLDDLITLGNHTTGNYVATLTGGTGITSTGATSGEGIAHSISVDASQTQITAIGTITTGVWNGTAIANTYVADDLTISGGTINNTPIGATTPNTGNFTNTKISGSLIVSASGETLNVNDVFAVNESNDGTVFQVSDISGMPMLEVSSSGLTQLSNRNIKLSSTGIEVVGANVKISGSSTSTGSFGKIEASGLPLSIGSTNVGIGIASPASNITLKVAGRSEIDGLLVVSSSAIPVASSSLKVIGSGSLFKVLDKSNTTQLNINDTTIGTIFSLNDISGFSLLEVSSSGLVQISKQNVKMDSSGIEVVSGNISGSATSTGSFGRLQASFLGGNSPIVIDADNISIDESGNITPPAGGNISGSATSTGSFGRTEVSSGKVLGVSTSGISTPFSIVGGTSTSAGGLQFGAYNGDFGGIWNGGVTPATNNYALVANATRTVLNAPTDIAFFISDSTNNFYMNSTGVGIGNTSPSHKLDVTGTGRFTDTLTTATITLGGKLTAGSNEIEGSNFDINGGTIDSTPIGLSGTSTANFSNITGSALRIGGSTSKFSLTDTTPNGTANAVFGDAMFGSTSTTNTGITMFGTGQVGIAFGDAAFDRSGQFRYQHGTNKFEIITDNVIRETIDSVGISVTGKGIFSGDVEANGNIVGDGDTTISGINTITTAGNISGSATSTGSFGHIQTKLTGHAQLGYALVGDWPNSATYAFFGNKALDQTAVGNYALTQHTGGTTYLNAASGTSINFRINNSNKMKLDSNGNLGIANNSPTEKLDVGGNIKASGNISGLATSTGSFGHLSVPGDAIIGGTITAQEFRTEFVNDIVIETSGSTKFGNSSDDTHQFTGSINLDAGNISGSLTSTGSFGRLETAGRTSFGDFTVVPNNKSYAGLDSSGNITGIIKLDSNNKTTIGNTTTSTGIVLSGNNVGIGQDTPTELLHIKQTGNDLTAIVIESTANHASAGSMINLTSNDGGTYILNHSTARTTTRYGIAVGGFFEILAQDSTNGIMIGNGTTNKPIIFGLNNKEQLRISENSISGSSTSTGSFGRLEIQPDTDATAHIGRALVGFGTNSDTATFGHIDQQSKIGFAQSQTGKVIVQTPSGQPIAFKIGGFDKMNLSSDGNLGIGIETATQKLHVVGNVFATGNISGSSTSTGSFGHLLGDASQLTNLPASGVTISNNANNRVLTGDGTNANAEANLFFDGTNLGIGKTAYGGIATVGAWFNDVAGSNGYSQIAVNGSNAALYLNQVGSGDLLIGYDNTTVTFTLGQDGSIVSSAGATIGGTVQGTTIRTSNGGGPQLVNSTPNGTTPSIHPTLGDTNTGIGYGGADGSTADNINLITGGTTGLYIDSSQNVVIPAGNISGSSTSTGSFGKAFLEGALQVEGAQPGRRGISITGGSVDGTRLMTFTETNNINSYYDAFYLNANFGGSGATGNNISLETTFGHKYTFGGDGTFETTGHVSGSSTSTGSFGMLNIGTETLRNNFSSSLAGRVATLSAASSGITISNNVNNRVLTGDGTNANAESGLTYNGSSLGITGDISISDATPKITLNDTTDDNYGEIIVSDGGNLTITSDGDDAGSSYTRFDVGTGEVLRLKSGGNVGIGTNNPSAKLHIYGGNWDTQLTIQNDNGNNNGIRFMEDGGAINGYVYGRDTGIISFLDPNGNYAYRHTHQTSHGWYLDNSQLMALTTTGLGIGITSPESTVKLHVYGGGITVDETGGTTNSAVLNLNADRGSADQDSGEIRFRNNSATSYTRLVGVRGSGDTYGGFQIRTRNSSGEGTRLAISEAGNVGIGASTPEAKLHVRLSDPSLTPAVSNVGMIIEENDHTYIELLTPNNKKSGVVFSDGQESGHIEYDHDTNSMNLKTGGSSNRVLIDSSGNVGVANTSPSEKLDVTGNIKASGTITAVGNLITQGDLIARNFIVSSSVTHMTQSFSSGSTIFGDTLTDTHKFTGSLDIVMSGSDALTIEGNTGPLFKVTDVAGDSLFTVTDVSGVPAFDIDNEYNVTMGNPTSPLQLVQDGSGNTILSGSATSTAKFGQFTEASSIAFKTNVETLKNPLDKISQLRGVTYNLKANNEPSIGMIAEEVNEVFPELVDKDDSGKPQAMSYTRITAVLLEAVKELTEEVKELKKSNIYNKYKDKE